jgi:ABC-type branched-subunit amino acid transport system substrate-binding protein
MFGAACGTTNNTQKAAKDYGDISSDAKTELDASGPTVETSTTLPTNIAAPTTAVGSKATRTTKPSTGGNIEPPALGAAPSAGFVGPGVTASEIKIGLTLVQSGTIFGDVTGVPVDFGDTRAQANAAVDYVNKNGGIAGRKVVPVYYTFDLTRPGLSDGQSEQEACSAWSEDSRVFAGINTALARQALLTCLASRGVPAIHNGMPIDEQTLNKYRNYWYAGYGGAALTLDRLAEKQVKVFAQQGLFGKDAVVGIEYFDDPAYKRVVDEVFKPELAKVGVSKVVLQGAPRGGAEATSYVAAFRAAGVTHVLFMGEGALYPLFFMRAADSQRYFPKYGLHTDMSLGQLLQPGAPNTQLANANVFGWTPIVDVDNAHDPGPVSARNSLCIDIMRKAGQDMSNRGAATTALGYCDGLFLLQDALAKVTKVDVAGLASGMASLGTNYLSPGVFGTKFLANKPDGAEVYRDMTYTRDCDCFRYVSGNKNFPA